MEFQQPQKNHTQKRSNNKTPSGNQSFHSKQKPTSTQQQQQQLEEEQQQTPPPPGIPTFRDEFLPCRRHLDPEGTFLPTSDWVQVDGTLALTSLEELVMSIENILYEELEHGVIDLEALWNPQQQGETVPLLPIQDTDGTNDDDNVVSPHFRIQAAHLMLSPFGRPTGWHLKLSNPSMVHALITRAESKKRVHVAWKMVLVKEYHPPTAAAAAETETEAPTAAKDGNAVQTTTTITNHINGFLVDNTMVRFENCPESLTEEHLRYLLSRYELARFGPTVMQWEGQTAQGKRHRMFVARFHDATWARAAVREKQDLPVGSRRLRLIQYPNQRLLEEKEQVQEEQQQQELHQKTA
ncbi:hypothetical protein IV203_003523 [Nitzschia inconspicua]|uniref:RRM domain-containing protein n=1 Tax=Nitzschia inconspicua TaxID=303405 RepID=A0A9K3L285_9STRA|nr:hypothetical protein IV203_003523 [Nitzschia inconspicua]